MAETEKHNMRIPDEIWNPAMRKAKRLRIPLTRVVKDALKVFVDEAQEVSAEKYGSPVADLTSADQ